MASPRMDKRAMSRSGLYVPNIETVYAGTHLYVTPTALGGTRGRLSFSEPGEPYVGFTEAQVTYTSDIPPLSVEGALHIAEEMIKMAFRQLELRKNS